MVYKHSSSDVQSDKIGKGSRIWQFSVILEGAVIGENCNICAHTFIEGDVVVGNNVTIKSGVYLWSGVRIEDNVFVGPNATFTNDLMPRSKQYPDAFHGAIVRKGASIGAGAVLLPGVTIGEGSMVGAGAVVTKDVLANTVVAGNPAKLVRHLK